MKKLLIAFTSVFVTSEVFAAFTEVENTTFGAAGFDITGTGSASELANTSYNWIRLSGTINFDDDTNIKLLSNNLRLGTSSYYAFTTLDALR